MNPWKHRLGTVLVLVLALGLCVLLPGLRGQVPPAVPPPPPVVAPAAAAGAPAPPASGLLGLFQALSESCKACKAKICACPLGQLITNAIKPINLFMGGIICPPCCPPISEEDLKKPSDTAEGACAKIRKEESEFPKRRDAVRCLKYVDCHWYPEAEAALLNALRTDRNECVRLEAASVLASGCCCTRNVLEKLVIVVSGSDRDGNPSENSPRVKAAAMNALAHCLECYTERVPEPPRKEKPEPAPAPAPGPPPAAAPPPAAGAAADGRSMAVLVAEARAVLARAQAQEASRARSAPPPPVKGDVYDILASAWRGKRGAGTPEPPLAEPKGGRGLLQIWGRSLLPGRSAPAGPPDGATPPPAGAAPSPTAAASIPDGGTVLVRGSEAPEVGTGADPQPGPAPPQAPGPLPPGLEDSQGVPHVRPTMWLDPGPLPPGLEDGQSREVAHGDGPAPTPPAEGGAVVQAGCSSCGGGGGLLKPDGPDLAGLGGDGGWCGCCSGGNPCVPNRKPCYPCDGTTFLGRFCCCLYECICCPDPCYDPHWIPIADAAFFTDAVRPQTQQRLRYEGGFNVVFPDRATYFWARADGAGIGPRPTFPFRGEKSVDYDDLRLYTEAAATNLSIFVELSYRAITPDLAPHAAGFGDMNLGTKTLLYDCELFQLGFQFKTYFPTGDPPRGLGNGQFALEPSLLLAVKLGPETYFQGQLAEWIPLSGDPFYQGSILHSHMSFNHVLWRPLPDVPIIGTLEYASWHFQTGAYTDPILGSFQKAGGQAYVSVGPGIRMVVCDKIDFGIGGLVSLTSAHWGDPVIRAEFRWRF